MIMASWRWETARLLKQIRKGVQQGIHEGLNRDEGGGVRRSAADALQAHRLVAPERHRQRLEVPEDRA